MATLRAALDGLRSQVSAALTPAPTGTTVDSIITGWPLPQALDASLKQPGHAVVSVWPLSPIHMARDGYLDGWIKNVLPAPTTTLTASALVLQALGSVTLTVAGTAKATDALSLMATPGDLPKQSSGAVYVLVTGDTTSTAASGLRNAIGAAVPMSSWMSATVLGSVVTVTNLRNALIALTVRVGGQGTFAREIERRMARVQVHVFAADPPTRDAVGDAIDLALATLPFTTPLQISLADNTQAMLMPATDEWMDQPQLGDFRRILTYELLWPVLASLPGYDVLIGSLTLTPLVLIDPHP